MKVTFVSPDGTSKDVEAREGDSILKIAHDHGVDLEGACEGSLACSTCHVILDEKLYETLPPPSDEENDMLDLAFGLTTTSRLGCQIKLDPNNPLMHGMRIQLPSATRNIQLEKQQQQQQQQQQAPNPNKQVNSPP